jgi:geranylgeranyl pyrophosphate synthase
MATLVHDDLIDGARTAAAAGLAAGRCTARTPRARRRLPLRARVRGAGGDRRRARGRDPRRRDALPRARRGDAAPQTHDPDTTVEAYLERCALKTGKLFEAACLLGGGDAAAFGLALGIAFQIADDILDCAGETIETGKIAGTDLREGTPTLPLLLAAREDEVVRAALAGGPLDGALVRVAATGALERERARSRSTTLEARARVPRTASCTATSSRR